MPLKKLSRLPSAGTVLSDSWNASDVGVELAPSANKARAGLAASAGDWPRRDAH